MPRALTCLGIPATVCSDSHRLGHRFTPPSIGLPTHPGGLMNIRETLTHVFPSECFQAGVPEHGGFFEVKGLCRGIAPRNCESLASGTAKARIGEAQRESYLVRTPDFLLFFRTCPERTGSQPAGFLVSCGCAPLRSAAAKDLEAYARRSIAALHRTRGHAVQPAQMPVDLRIGLFVSGTAHT